MSSWAKETLNRKKSVSSQAASISDWWIVFDCPSMVAALTCARYFPLSRSAARRMTAARSSNDHAPQSFWARLEASIAAWMWAAAASWESASTCLWLWGETTGLVFPVEMCCPSMTRGMSTRSAAMDFSTLLISARSGLPGA